jgi:hypothetical protein
MPICIKCNTKFPNRMIINNEMKTLNKRSYCLTCSPYGEHNTKVFDRPIKYKCACGETNSDKFYGHKRSVCGKCHNEYTQNLYKQKRRKVIETLGGKCANCDFDKWPEALDVHHTNPAIKDEDFAGMRHWSWDRIEKEISTCILLCKNCHAHEHKIDKD